MPIALNGSSQYLQWLGNSHAAYPFSLFAWLKPSSTSSTMFAVASGRLGLDEWQSILASNSATIQASERKTGSSAQAALSGALVTNWKPCLVVYTTAANRKVYYDAASATDTANNAPTIASFDVFSIGKDPRTGQSSYWAGEIAEVACWGAALSAGDLATLAGGAAPETVQAGSLIDCWPLQTAGGLAGVNGRVLTATGSPVTGGAHPITRNTSQLAGSIALDDVVAAGTLASIPSSLTGTIALDDLAASGTLGQAPGTVTVPGLRNAARSLVASTSIANVLVIRIADRAVLASLGAQFTNGSGDLVLSGVAFVPGTPVMVLGFDASGANSFRRAVVVV